jgi:hypothetical protein
MAKISTLIDDFQDNSIDVSKWTVTGGAETSGRARLTPSTSFAFWAAATSYDLTSSQITSEVPVVTPAGFTGSLQSGISIQRDVNNLIGMRKFGTELICSKKVAGVSSDLSFTPYNATNHRYWRIRESGGIVYWETSATGVGAFFIQNTATVASLFPMTVVTPYFFAGFSGFEFAPGTLEIEAVNLGIQITASGESTSSGTAALLVNHVLTGSGVSTSAGSVAITIPPLTHHEITASGTGVSTGTASFIILAPEEMTAAGESFSSGSAALTVLHVITAVGQSFSTGTAALTTITPPPPPADITYFYFEPPIAYDNPPTLPRPVPKYINAHARWKGGQRRGRSVLKEAGVYRTVDTPTVDETLAAEEVYMGGHIYTIPNTIAEALSTAGYVVTPIPVTFTLFPDFDVYPQTDTFPGYQDFVFP